MSRAWRATSLSQRRAWASSRKVISSAICACNRGTNSVVAYGHVNSVEADRALIYLGDLKSLVAQAINSC